MCTKIEVIHFGLRKDLPEHTIIEHVLGDYVFKGEKNRGAPIYKLDTHHAKTRHADVMYNGHYWQGRVILKDAFLLFLWVSKLRYKAIIVLIQIYFSIYSMT